MSRFEFTTQPVDEAEDVVGVFYGRRGQVGQQIVVTNRRLLLGPIDLGLALAIDNYLLVKASPPVGDFVQTVLGHYAPLKTVTVWLRHIVDIRPTNNAGWFKPPRMRVTTDTDQTYDLGIVLTTMTIIGDGRNNAARDKAIKTIRAAVQSAKAASVGPTV